jgi:small subunit ribosomal protein S6
MRKYELMYIVRPTLEEEATKALIERFQKVAQDQGAEVTGIDEKGKRRLAYEINDLKEGYYVVMNFTSGPDAIPELERQLRLHDDVLRHLVVNEDDM